MILLELLSNLFPITNKYVNISSQSYFLIYLWLEPRYDYTKKFKDRALGIGEQHNIYYFRLQGEL